MAESEGLIERLEAASIPLCSEGDVEPAAALIAGLSDDAMAETAYATGAALAHLFSRYPSLDGLPLVVIGFSAGMSLEGAIVFLLWLWIANNALLFGAEFDAELERGRELEAGIPAEERIQLPPRDTRKIDKAEEKEKEDIELGRRIREAHAGDAAREAAEEDARRG